MARRDDVDGSIGEAGLLQQYRQGQRAEDMILALGLHHVPGTDLNGDSGDGFRTNVQPAARAVAIFRTARATCL